MMRILSKCLLIIFISALSTAAHAAIPAQNLLKGQATTVDVDYEIGDVAIADPKVCDFVVAKERRQIYLNPKEAGKTTLTVWDVGGTKRDEIPVVVFTTTLAEVLRQAKESFGSLDGITVELRDNRVVLSGNVFEKDDLRAIDAFTQTNPTVSSKVRLAPEILRTMTDAIAKSIATPGIEVKAIRDQVVLDGVAHSPADAQRAFEIAKLYVPDVKNLLDVRDTGRRIGRGPMVELDVKLMEIKKSGLKSLGIQWAPGAFPASGAGTASTGNASGLLGGIAEVGRSLIGFVFNLIPRLRTLSERGEARVLENPTLVVKSGEKAELFSGAEVPYFRGDEVQFKEVGVKISAEPVVAGDEIDLKISATLSAPSAHIEGAVDRNTVSTSAIVRRDQSVVLGGIIHTGDVTTKNRVPKGVDTSTALFSLFLSKDFQSKQSEFVIFVTPRVVHTPTAAEAKLAQWAATEENIVRARSKQDHRAYLEKRGQDVPVQPKRRRWQ